jgi:hypothetical protein
MIKSFVHVRAWIAMSWIVSFIQVPWRRVEAILHQALFFIAAPSLHGFKSRGVA